MMMRTNPWVVESVVVEGLRPLLFDCLSEEEDLPPLLNKKAVLESIKLELSDLLNTRSIFPWYRKEALDFIHPLTFGFCDFSALDPSQQSHWPPIEQAIERVIQTYEPRICDVDVRITYFSPQTQKLTLHIKGVVPMGREVLPLDHQSQVDIT